MVKNTEKSTATKESMRRQLVCVAEITEDVSGAKVIVYVKVDREKDWLNKKLKIICRGQSLS